MNTLVYNPGGSGTQNEGLSFGGEGNAGGRPNCTEEYNGSTWTAVTVMGTARGFLTGAGTQNSTLGFGGTTATGITGSAESYNGTSWTAEPGMIAARTHLAGAGTDENTVVAFGGLGPAGRTSATEEFNGSTWATTNNLPSNGINANTGYGTQNAASSVGGFCDSPFTTLCCHFTYNGSSWGFSSPLPVTHAWGAGAGTQNAGLVFGGTNGPGTTYEYNGVSWAIGNSLNHIRTGLAGAGTQANGLAFGGFPVAGCTEEYNF